MAERSFALAGCFDDQKALASEPKDRIVSTASPLRRRTAKPTRATKGDTDAPPNENVAARVCSREFRKLKAEYAEEVEHLREMEERLNTMAAAKAAEKEREAQKAAEAAKAAQAAQRLSIPPMPSRGRQGSQGRLQEADRDSRHSGESESDASQQTSAESLAITRQERCLAVDEAMLIVREERHAVKQELASLSNLGIRVPRAPGHESLLWLSCASQRSEEVRIAAWLHGNGFKGVNKKKTSFLRRHSQFPLHVAVTKKDAVMIGLLIHHGADMDAKNSSGLTPLQLARKSNKSVSHDAVLQVFLDEGCTA